MLRVLEPSFETGLPGPPQDEGLLRKQPGWDLRSEELRPSQRPAPLYHPDHQPDSVARPEPGASIAKDQTSPELTLASWK